MLWLCKQDIKATPLREENNLTTLLPEGGWKTF